MARVQSVVVLLLAVAVAGVLARDAWQTLGLRRGASEAQIKRAYKKLAVQYHPDKNGGDEAAKDKFVEIQAAYEALTKKASTGHGQQFQQQQQHRQHQYYYSYEYTSTPPREAATGSMLYVLVLVGLVCMFIWSQLNADDDAPPPRPSPQTAPPTPKAPPAKVATSASPFHSLASKYAPSVVELSDAVLARKGRRTLIFCVRNSPEYCSHLAQWLLMEQAATAFARDPITCAWCDIETGPMRAQWQAFFDQQGLVYNHCVAVAVVNQTKCAVLTSRTSLTFADVERWASKLLGGEIEQRSLAMDVPVLAPVFV
ncbi:hypothetical protein ACHHYP_02396 [Achlya hypogyna]|uniref:J domain-containing protein n=1 Tax=Achlya hypogyna TaxID=1202772 RepID=A0A1V9Z6Q7_ACHHY|nr:hypothetical protein ACHHYP_02396 [Achlya hypogyna]